MNHFQPQALEFMEKEIVLASERYLGKSVFPKQVEGVDIGAYLLVTFDGDNMEQLEELTEQAAEVVLDAGAVDVLVADTPAKKKDAWAARSSFLRPSRRRQSFSMSATSSFRSTRSRNT